MTPQQWNKQQHLVDSLQKDCHRVVDGLMKSSGKGLTVQDCTNVWIYNKLAEYEIRLRELEANIPINKGE
jgi:hypothetical protein